MFGWLKKRTRTPSAAEDSPREEPQAPDLRAHERYGLDRHGAAKVCLAEGREGTLRDLSYGGIGAEFPLETPIQLPEGEPVAARLWVLGCETACSLVPVRTVDQSTTRIVGFQFRHDAPDTLMFLREMLEPLRRGRSLRQVAEDLLAEEYRGGDWICLRGDGPTQLMISAVPGACYANLFYRDRDSDHEVIYVKEGAKPRPGLLQLQSSSPMAGEDAPTVLTRIALLTLLGMSDEAKKNAASILEAAWSDFWTRVPDRQQAG